MGSLNMGTATSDISTGLGQSSATDDTSKGRGDDWLSSSGFLNELSNGVDSTAIKIINKRHSDQTKVDSDKPLINIPQTVSSIYSKPVDQGRDLKTSQANQDSSKSAVSQKQPEASDDSWRSKFVAYINSLSEDPIRNGTILSPDTAWSIIKSDAIHGEKMIQALDTLTRKAIARDGPFRIFYSKEGRIQDFCSTLTKHSTETDALLHLRKRIFPFAAPSITENSTDRDLLVDGLIKEIDPKIDKNLDGYVKGKAEYALNLKDPDRIKRMYEDALSYIKSVKSNMPIVSQPLTPAWIEKESLSLLKEIGKSIDKILDKYIKDKTKEALVLKDQNQVKKIYEEALSYIKSVKSSMPTIAKKLTAEQIAGESIALLKGIDIIVNKNLEPINQQLAGYIKDRLENSLVMEDPQRLKIIYAELLSYIKSIRSNMPSITKNLTPEQVEEESIDFLVKELANICAQNDFNSKVMLETQVLPEEARYRFAKHLDKRIEQEINSLKKENKADSLDYVRLSRLARGFLAPTRDPHKIKMIAARDEKISELERIKSSLR